MLLRFIPSIRNIFIAVVEAGLGPADLLTSGAASKYPKNRIGKSRVVQKVIPAGVYY